MTPDTKAVYTKFSIRKSIDRPLVSVAAVAGGNDIKVVAGGVSIVPHVVHGIDDVLSDGVITEDAARKAGDIAVEKAVPMSMNAWKVQVMRTLVKRSLLAIT